MISEPPDHPIPSPGWPRPPPGLPRWSEGLCTRMAGSPSSPPPPGLPRWSVGLCTRARLAPSVAPTGLAPVERGLAPRRWGSAEPPHWCTSPRSTGASPVRAENGGRPSCAEAFPPPGQARWGQKPALHRDKPGGGGEGGPPFLCRSPRSTGASPVGAVRNPGSPPNYPIT